MSRLALMIVGFTVAVLALLAVDMVAFHGVYAVHYLRPMQADCGVSCHELVSG